MTTPRPREINPMMSSPGTGEQHPAKETSSPDIPFTVTDPFARCSRKGCKTGAVDKSEIGIPDELKLNRGCGHESMCNPILQAKVLAAQGTDLNILIGLCAGHDTLFLRHSQAPVTVMIVKDRVLAHNPVGALYTATTGYSRFKKELGL